MTLPLTCTYTPMEGWYELELQKGLVPARLQLGDEGAVIEYAERAQGVLPEDRLIGTLNSEWVELAPADGMLRLQLYVTYGAAVVRYTSAGLGAGVSTSPPIVGWQVRAARRLLGWDGVSLAMRAGVNPQSLVRFETGGPLPAEAVTAVRRALEVAGIEFLPEGKARLRDAVEEAMP